MQALIYLFIALAGAGVGAAAYFGLAFSIIEAAMAGLLFLAFALVVFERSQRRRAEIRFENAIEDLSRLLSTDAQAGGVLSQRVNALVDVNAGHRLDVVEADISVLGTVVRQVAEAVATLEEARNQLVGGPVSYASHDADGDEVSVPEEHVEPAIPAEDVRQAIADGRLVFHAEPIITLPQRRNHGYDLVARIEQDNGEFLEAAQFLPRQGGEALIRRVDEIGIQEAIALARRARADGRPIVLYVPISRATFADQIAVEQLAVLLEANRSLVPLLALRIHADDWASFSDAERAATQAIARKGIGFSLAGARSLRLDMAGLAAAGFRSIRVDTATFVDRTQMLTDLHSVDVVPYLRRFSIEFIASGLATEQQILTLLDDEVGLAMGPRAGGPAPLRADFEQQAVSASRRA